MHAIRRLLALLRGVPLRAAPASPGRPWQTGRAEPTDGCLDTVGPRTVSDLRLGEAVEAILAKNPHWSAESLVSEADLLGMREDYGEAAAHNLAALSLSPGHRLARLRLAHSLSLWGHEYVARAVLQEAVRDGVISPEITRDAGSEVRLRSSAAFQTLMEKARQRHASAGRTQVRIPKGGRPPEGWPVLLFLHGCGDTGHSLLDYAASVASGDTLTVTVGIRVIRSWITLSRHRHTALRGLRFRVRWRARGGDAPGPRTASTRPTNTFKRSLPSMRTS
jgi:hypothetical protein